MYRINIRGGKEKNLIKHHPWVFSGAIESVEPHFTKEDWAEVRSKDGEFIAWGWYDEISHIILHLISWDEALLPDKDYISSLVKASVLRRKEFFSIPDTTAFRLIHGEADFLPGVAADVYGKEIRIVLSSRFAFSFVDVIASELFSLLKPHIIQVSIDSQYQRAERLGEEVFYYIDGRKSKTLGDENNTCFIESGLYYELPHGKGQKTGFYTDQRENRNIIERYTAGKTVLDVCSYTGAFSLHALRSGASFVTAIDSSESALRHYLFQVNLNEEKGTIPKGSRSRTEIIADNAFERLRAIEKNKYDLIILDPPKLSKTKGELEKAEKAYKDLNRIAMTKIKNNGIIATFSCSSAMTSENLQKIISWAAWDCRFEIQLLNKLGAGSDHPIRISFPESEYLKGFIFRVIKN